MIEVAYRTSPVPGEIANGDAVISRVDGHGRRLVGVIDGLGHGPHAAAAANAALAFLGDARLDGDLAPIMEGLHAHLRGTRGAAATLCLIVDQALCVCGVGNVSLRTSGTQVAFVLSPGILGGRVSRFRIARALLRRGDRVVLHSDGLRSDFHLDAYRAADTEETCRALFDGHRRPTDDATVLVCDISR